MTVQVHRFGDKIALAAISSEGGATVYLDGNAMLEIACAAMRIANEISIGVPFTRSNIGTTLIEGTHER